MKVFRLERNSKSREWDSKARKIERDLETTMPELFGRARVTTSDVYWVRCSDANAARVLTALTDEILVSPLLEVTIGEEKREGEGFLLEKRFKPGMTDNPARVLEEAVRIVCGETVRAKSGQIVRLEGVNESEAATFSSHVFHNALIESAVMAEVGKFKSPKPGFAGDVLKSVHEVKVFELAQMSDVELEALSRDRMLALTLEEMHSIQKKFKKQPITDVELEILAQTWSEHCKHKIFAAKIRVKEGREETEVDSLFKTYIRGSTEKIKKPWLKSVFHDNAGVVAMTDDKWCAIKVETHNSPSALDPYGGALTGIVGVNRDILGVGLGADPVANLDVFCVGDTNPAHVAPEGLHHPSRILEGIREGVEHGGNKSGIPTVTGAVVHDEGFTGKPLVFCGTVGVMPANTNFIEKKIESGDAIVIVGGRVGRDGIHGATFSSAVMDEETPPSVVQLGDPLTQKRVRDFMMEARDAGLYRTVTDNGAGGLASSVGELARLSNGARLNLDANPLKVPGLRPWEIAVSESQERMTFAVMPEKVKVFLELSKRRGVEASVVGTFESTGKFELFHAEEHVAKLELEFLHEGAPQMKLIARIEAPKSGYSASILETEDLRKVLAHPNVRSRRQMVRQYDHEVQANTFRKPYGSPGQMAPGSGSAVCLSRETFEGFALGLGLAPQIAKFDAKTAAEMALDEAIRNAVCAGGDPERTALVDNFCWPDPLPAADNPDAEEKLGALVASCRALHDASVAMGMPFVSGKDSMKNDARVNGERISVPPTVLITALSKVNDVRQAPRGFVCGAGRTVFWVAANKTLFGSTNLPNFDAKTALELAKALHAELESIETLQDVDESGFLGSTAQTALGTGFGFDLTSKAPLFAMPASAYVVIAKPGEESRVRQALSKFGFFVEAGKTTVEPRLRINQAEYLMSELEVAYGCV